MGWKSFDPSDMNIDKITTLGELKKANYVSRPVKIELRENLIQRLKNKEEAFPDIWGYEETVIPEVERAILSRHNINLLGLRGQAKTRIARLMVNLLDEYIPAVAGSEINDDPFHPISRFARDLVAEKGDATPIVWIHRNERYTEKLATPDVTVADLIGDLDPIKAANLKLSYSDERVIHFGLIPRAHRGIFVINELPDLQARIQVALFNILQEGDIQIRGFKLRLPLDIQFVFTANPEDYTNRGSIVTPLKDRIESQIITHYPKYIHISKKITEQESNLLEEQRSRVGASEIVKDLIEQIAFEARDSEFVDAKSGVSARLTISAFENLISTAERRAILNNEKHVQVRLLDLYGVIPAITGKVELVYEGEVEGPAIVAQNLIGKAIRTIFPNYFPSPEKIKKLKAENPFGKLTEWFGNGNTIDVFNDMTDKAFESELSKVGGLSEAVETYHANADVGTKKLLAEFILFGLAEFSQISKNKLVTGIQFKDLLGSIFNLPKDDDFEDDDE